MGLINELGGIGSGSKALLAPQAQEDAYRWATVTRVNPTIRVRLDGDNTEMPVTPDCLTLVTLGDRVWVQMFGRRVIILGRPGGPAEPPSGGGVTDHGMLSGLGDDDHTQYHNNVRGDLRYSKLGHTHPYAPLDHNHDPVYLSPNEILPGSNVTVDSISVPGSVIINSSGGGGGPGGGDIEEVFVGTYQPVQGEEIWIDTDEPDPESDLRPQSYRHFQSILSQDWTINHNLGWHPAVGIEDAGGSLMYGSVTHISESALTVHFAVPITGSATCT
jgi:hypothetical protein